MKDRLISFLGEKAKNKLIEKAIRPKYGRFDAVGMTRKRN